jgi:predicted O-methyltransferase YrrM
MSVLKAFRYFMINPRYTLLYRLGKPATVLQAVAGRQSPGYESLRDELVRHPEFGRQLADNLQSKTGESFRWNQDHYFLYALVRLTKPRLILETGVFDGFFSACFLQGLHVNAETDGIDGRLVSIDLPAYLSITASTSRMLRTHLPEGCEPGWVIPEYLRSRWRVHLGDSRELLPRISAEVGNIDLFFHDSLHTYEHMMFEYRTIWPLLQPAAILLSHDVHWNHAFRDFVREHRQRNHVAHGFGAIKKIS